MAYTKRIVHSDTGGSDMSINNEAANERHVAHLYIEVLIRLLYINYALTVQNSLIKTLLYVYHKFLPFSFNLSLPQSVNYDYYQ